MTDKAARAYGLEAGMSAIDGLVDEIKRSQWRFVPNMRGDGNGSIIAETDMDAMYLVSKDTCEGLGRYIVTLHSVLLAQKAVADTAAHLEK